MSQIRLPIYLRSYIISDMYISIYSADAEVYSSREIDYYQQSLRAKRRNSEPSFWTSCGEDVSSLSPARLRPSSATLLCGVRPFPRNAPSAELLMGAAPRAHKPYPQSSSTAFRADLRCAAPLSASLSLRCKRWEIPLGLHLLPLPSPPGGSGVVG
jgi:hypothetical protein